MRIALAVLLCALLTSARAQPRNLYVLYWVSPLPVHLSRVEAAAGRLIQLTTAGDDLSGSIAALAPRACLTIRAEGQTTAGIAVSFAREWDAECDRVWVPLILR